MFVLNRNTLSLLGISLLASLLFFLPGTVQAANVDEVVATVKDLFPILKLIPERLPSIYSNDSAVFAQTAGFGGGSSMVIYFKEINGIPAGPAACPTAEGWSEALDGYGPHYLGILGYDWYQDGSGGTGGGFLGPGTPPTPPPPPGGGEPQDPPPPPEPGGAPPAPREPETEEPEDPPPPPEGTVETPDETPPNPPSGTPPPQGGGGGGGSYLHKNKFDIASILIPKAEAQSVQTTYLATVSIGSDSVCSQSQYIVVPYRAMYQNVINPPSFRLYSDACGVNPTTGLTECNRCKVCYK